MWVVMVQNKFMLRVFLQNEGVKPWLCGDGCWVVLEASSCCWGGCWVAGELRAAAGVWFVSRSGEAFLRTGLDFREVTFKAEQSFDLPGTGSC